MPSTMGARSLFALSVVAGLASVALADNYYVKTEYFDTDATCTSAPRRVLYQLLDQSTCESSVTTCVQTDVGLGVYTYQQISCLHLNENTVPVPNPALGTYVATVDNKFDFNCIGLPGNWYFEYLLDGQCVFNGVGAFHKYDVRGDTAMYTNGCSDATCSNCWATPKTVVLLSCNLNGGTAQRFYFPNAANVVTAIYTHPYAFLASPLPTSNAISGTKDCYASVGTSVFGGWTIVYEGEPVLFK